MIKNALLRTQLAQASSVDDKNLASMTKNACNDSRTMRIATIVATFYLPANLVVVGLLASAFSVLYVQMQKLILAAVVLQYRARQLLSNIPT
jgi:hypothetical protein